MSIPVTPQFVKVRLSSILGCKNTWQGIMFPTGILVRTHACCVFIILFTWFCLTTGQYGTKSIKRGGKTESPFPSAFICSPGMNLYRERWVCLCSRGKHYKWCACLVTFHRQSFDATKNVKYQLNPRIRPGSLTSWTRLAGWTELVHSSGDLQTD